MPHDYLFLSHGNLLDETAKERTHHHLSGTASIKAKSLSPYRPVVTDEGPAEKTTRDNSREKPITKRGPSKPMLLGSIPEKSYARATSPRQNESRVTERKKLKDASLVQKPATMTISKDEYNKLKELVDEYDSKINFLQLEKSNYLKNIQELKTENTYYKGETENLSNQIENLTKLYETLASDRRSQFNDKRVQFLSPSSIAKFLIG